MAVYTKLDFSDIADFLKNYEIGELVSFKEIIDGIDNSNFIIETDSGRFILTIFESRINKDELPFFINLKAHLAAQKVCCPNPIANKNGDLINKIKGKEALIVTFLSGATLKPQENGVYASIKPQHCFEIGKNLAILHLGVHDFKENKFNELGIKGFGNLFGKMADKIDSYEAGLKAEIENYLDFLQKKWSPEIASNLASGVVHADLFPDNVFFDENDKISGIIDFYFSATDLFIYDLAIIINAWAFDAKNQFDQEKFEQILKGYETIRKLPKEEKEFLNIALVAAALRFLLTRLYDTFNTPKGSLVKIKNPQEYLQKIRFFHSKCC